jgi:hypothetical protein
MKLHYFPVLVLLRIVHLRQLITSGYCANLSPNSSTISQPLECTGQTRGARTPWRTHSCAMSHRFCATEF